MPTISRVAAAPQGNPITRPVSASTSVSRKIIHCTTLRCAPKAKGHINRLKAIKRQMYGRAGFDLLKARVGSRTRRLTCAPKVRKILYFMDIAPNLIRRFGEYVTFLRNLGLKPPFRWIAGFEGISKMTLEFPPPARFFPVWKRPHLYERYGF
jgi:hypothetical protein